MTYKFRKSGRVMLGDIIEPEMIIYDNVIIATENDNGKPDVDIVDCQIRFYLGGKPITLHNDSSDLKNLISVEQYIDKLKLIRDIVLGVVKESKENPDINFIDRAFLNPPIPATRLFGGTLLVHYHGVHKLFTIDISDCNNKSRRSFNCDDMVKFTTKLVDIINESLVSVLEIKEIISESK